MDLPLRPTRGREPSAGALVMAEGNVVRRLPDGGGGEVANRWFDHEYAFDFASREICA